MGIIMAERRAVMLRSLFLLISIFLVKREAFITSLELNFDLKLEAENYDVILSSESFVYSSIWNYSYKNKFYKEKPLSLFMLLLISGDIHPCPGPDTVQHIKVPFNISKTFVIRKA